MWNPISEILSPGAGGPLQLALAVYFCAIMLAAAVQDARELRIGNLLVLGLALGWPAQALAGARPPGAMALDAMAALGILLIGFALFERGWIGAGDAKLAAATALWFGPLGTVPYLLYAAVAGAAVCIGLLVLRLEPLRRRLAGRRWRRRLRAGRVPVPYGLALAAGALAGLARGLPLQPG